MGKKGQGDIPLEFHEKKSWVRSPEIFTTYHIAATQLNVKK